MKNLQKVALTAAMLLSCATPALAGPGLGYAVVGTPYGTFGCKQRAETKLFSIGATNISKGSTIWADYQDYTIGIWCRGSEAIIMVSGNSPVADLRNELKSAF